MIPITEKHTRIIHLLGLLCRTEFNPYLKNVLGRIGQLEYELNQINNISDLTLRVRLINFIFNSYFDWIKNKSWDFILKENIKKYFAQRKLTIVHRTYRKFKEGK